MTNEDLGPSLAMDADPVAEAAMKRRAVVACMGGWCKKRLVCTLYWAGSPFTRPGHIAERLCPAGLDQPVSRKDSDRG